MNELIPSSCYSIMIICEHLPGHNCIGVGVRHLIGQDAMATMIGGATDDNRPSV